MVSINYRDTRPIYEQIKENLRRMILSGSIQTGERLPSVREMATDLAINPNTIQRAYSELESEGFIYTVVGKGSFAAPLDEGKEQRRAQLLQTFTQTADELQRLGVAREELIHRLDMAKEE